MNTSIYGAPRLSRAKALVGALLATLAIGGAVQATAPESASAMKNECYPTWLKAYKAEEEGFEYLAVFWRGVAEVCEKG